MVRRSRRGARRRGRSRRLRRADTRRREARDGRACDHRAARRDADVGARRFDAEREAVVREEGVSAIIVEQNPRLILPITARAVVLDRGAIVHEGDSAELLADRERLDRWLAVARA